MIDQKTAPASVCCPDSGQECSVPPAVADDPSITADDAALAAYARALAHPARIAMLRQLIAATPCICGEMVDHLGLPQSTVSQHLRVLKESGLISATPAGRTVCYAIDPHALRRLRMVICAL